jgi:hypothetical protein
MKGVLAASGGEELGAEPHAAIEAALDDEQPAGWLPGHEGSASVWRGWHGSLRSELHSPQKEIPISIAVWTPLRDFIGRYLDEEDIMTQLSSQQSLPQEGISLHELNHRINNEFAAAISVVSLAAARSGNNEVKAALSGVAELLHRYADVHRALQAPERDIVLDAETYLRQLCPFNQSIVSRSSENQACACDRAVAAAGGSLLAPRNDRLRAHHQFGAAYFFRRRR